MTKRRQGEQVKGLSFPKIGNRYYVFYDGRNALGGHDTREQAEAAAEKYFRKGRKKQA